MIGKYTYTSRLRGSLPFTLTLEFSTDDVVHGADPRYLTQSLEVRIRRGKIVKMELGGSSIEEHDLQRDLPNLQGPKRDTYRIGDTLVTLFPIQVTLVTQLEPSEERSSIPLSKAFVRIMIDKLIKVVKDLQKFFVVGYEIQIFESKSRWIEKDIVLYDLQGGVIGRGICSNEGGLMGSWTLNLEIEGARFSVRYTKESDTYKYYFPSGEKQIEESYTIQGTLLSHDERDNFGQRNGESTDYFPEDGSLKSRAYYKNGKIIGESIAFHSPSVLRNYSVYSEDHRLLKVTEYYNPLLINKELQSLSPFSIITLQEDGTKKEVHYRPDGSLFRTLILQYFHSEWRIKKLTVHGKRERSKSLAPGEEDSYEETFDL